MVSTAISPSERARTHAPASYVALGDSFSAGVDGDEPWPALAAEVFRGRGPGVSFASLARVGATSDAVLEQQLPCAIGYRPELVSVVCGANDVLMSLRPDARRFARTLETLLRRLTIVLPGTLVITATYPAVAPEGLRERSRRRVESGLVDFNAEIRWLSGVHGAFCIDWARHPEIGRQHNYAEDGFHPSPEAHRIAAGEFVAAVDAVLGEPDRTEDR